MTTWRSWIRSSDNNDGALAMRLRFPADASQCDNKYDTSQTNRKDKNIYVLVNEVESVKQDWRGGALLQGHTTYWIRQFSDSRASYVMRISAALPFSSIHN